uniref:Uncharacterized protein n=1 Tax=uncultured prokaryote TaxID=198431 RepID=A0A0H5Q7T7_9ZZZZ|nr:hypothetical protein [uncultured prokaryote]
MASLLAQVTIPYITSIPTDISINTWSFESSLDNDLAAADIAEGLEDFYAQIGTYLSPVLNPAVSRLKIYDRADPEPRVPFYDETLVGPGNNTGTIIPEEVAACLSFRGALTSGASQRRRRGRVYLGPLSITGVAAGGTGRSEVKTAFVTAIHAGADALLTALGATTEHVVHSGVGGTDTVVTTYWVDNAFDTQRRRGPDASSRTTWTS